MAQNQTPRRHRIVYRADSFGAIATTLLAQSDRVRDRCRSRVHSGTAPFNTGAYTCDMQCGSLKAVIAMFWVSAVSTAGTAGNLKSFSSWTVLAGIALPPLFMMRRGNPRQSISPSIKEALR
jgi:hypothetical protein